MQHVCTGPGCGKLHDRRGRCPECKVEHGRDDRAQRELKSPVRSLYYTARWRYVREVILARDHHLCQQCVRENRTTTGNHIDHIKNAIKFPGLFFTLSNLQTLCHSCHSKKTNAQG